MAPSSKKFFFSKKDLLILWSLIEVFSQIQYSPGYFKDYGIWMLKFPEEQSEIDATNFIYVWSRFSRAHLLCGEERQNKNWQKLTNAASVKIKFWNLMKKNYICSTVYLMRKMYREQTLDMLFATLTLIQLDKNGLAPIVATILKYLNWEEFARVMILSNDYFYTYLTDRYGKSFCNKIFIENSQLYHTIPMNFCLSRGCFYDIYNRSCTSYSGTIPGRILNDSFKLKKINLLQESSNGANFGEKLLNQRINISSIENDFMSPPLMKHSADFNNGGIVGAFNSTRELVAFTTRKNVVEIHQIQDSRCQQTSWFKNYSLKSLKYRFDGKVDAWVTNLSWAPTGDFLLIEVTNQDEVMSMGTRFTNTNSNILHYKSLIFLKINHDFSVDRINKSGDYVVNSQLSSHSMWLSANQFLLVGNHDSKQLEILTFDLSDFDVTCKCIHKNIHQIVPGCRSDLTKNLTNFLESFAFSFCNAQYVGVFFGIPLQGSYETSLMFGVVLNCPFLHDHDRIAVFHITTISYFIRLYNFIDIPGNLMTFNVDMDSKLLLAYSMEPNREYNKDPNIVHMTTPAFQTEEYHQCSFFSQRRFGFLCSEEVKGCVIASISIQLMNMNMSIHMHSKTLYRYYFFLFMHFLFNEV